MTSSPFANTMTQFFLSGLINALKILTRQADPNAHTVTSKLALSDPVVVVTNQEGSPTTIALECLEDVFWFLEA